MNIRVCDICGDTTKEAKKYEFIHHLGTDEAHGEHFHVTKDYNLCIDCHLAVLKEAINSLEKAQYHRERLLCKIIDQKVKERNGEKNGSKS